MISQPAFQMQDNGVITDINLICLFLNLMLLFTKHLTTICCFYRNVKKRRKTISGCTSFVCGTFISRWVIDSELRVLVN